MRIDEVRGLDWRQDKNLLAVEQKLEGLAERETKARARLEELDQIVRVGNQSLVQVRAAEMLSETSDESVEMIQQRLESAQRETADLRSTLEALKLARTRLAPAVLAATSAAKLQVGVVLAPVYRKAAEALRELLAKAAEVNQVLHAVHDQSMKCDLRRETHARQDLKPLGFPVALNILGLPGGKPSPELELWHAHVDRLFNDH